MKKVKILHCGDFHFDTPFKELSGSIAEQRKEDLRETFGRVIQTAKDEKVNLLLISGDFFDNDRVMKTTLDYLIRKFEEIPHIRVFISPGNHDPYTYKSYYRLIRWPSNVHIFDTNLKGIWIPEYNTCVYGIGFSKKYERKSLIEGFHVENKELVNIMVLHGDMVSEGQGSDYNPIARGTIESSGLDYLALGHRHSFSGVTKLGATSWSYCGNPEGRAFDELGSKGVVVGTVEKGRCELSFREICKRKYMVAKVDVEGVGTYEEIVERIREQITDPERERNLYKIILTGEIGEGFSIHREVLQDKLHGDFYYIKLVDETTFAVDYESLAREFSLKGIFVRNMKEKIDRASNEEERKRLICALKLGMKALGTGEVRVE
ncbi:metallophosphoesterase family protein [Thermotalea metallivorans]|uniref:Putative metallophosphoesterase YhaO n=1 Tax=Thermotalea metallivorans TaxID=520762 RepID=A0A140L785_9FIRM|nr:DNA repair exonuclease [Thermotalea metallivorans]KXG76410.1 putative metallophosphoesterase YhaO [Thermotalea metallivorans]